MIHLTLSLIATMNQVYDRQCYTVVTYEKGSLNYSRARLALGLVTVKSGRVISAINLRALSHQISIAGSE